MDKLNLRKLNATTKKLEEFRNKTYNEVKKQCYNRINIISKAPKNFCWFIIPKLIIGYPPIDIDECAEYLKNELNKEPVVYDFFSPNIFYITWGPKALEKK